MDENCYNIREECNLVCYPFMCNMKEKILIKSKFYSPYLSDGAPNVCQGLCNTVLNRRIPIQMELTI